MTVEESLVTPGQERAGVLREEQVQHVRRSARQVFGGLGVCYRALCVRMEGYVTH